MARFVTPDPDARMASPEPTYCYTCDRLVQLVATNALQFTTHCPCCQRRPSARERSLHTYPDELTQADLKRIFGPRDA